MMVTYNFYSSPYVDKANAYKLADNDYDEMGQGYGNFSNEDVAEALNNPLSSIYAS